MAVLKTSDFALELIYDKNAVYVNIDGLNYSGRHKLCLDKREFTDFVLKLEKFYSTLEEGELRLQEEYEHDFISFTSDGMGHFEINGEFNNWGNWYLTFCETVDQTYLRGFINRLKEEI